MAREKQELNTLSRLCVGLTLIGVMFSVVAFAQESIPSQPPQDVSEASDAAGANATQEAVNVESSAPLVPSAPSPVESQIRPTGNAIPWFGSTSPLRWGGLGINGFVYDWVDDHFQPQGLPTNIIKLSVLRSAITYDRFFNLFGNHQHLVLEYDPQVAMLNWKVAANGGLNNTFTFGTTFQLTPRLSLAVNDGFVQFRSQQLFADNVLAVDQQAGGLIQGDFLQNAGSYIGNTIQSILTYAITPRLLLTVGATYTYAHALNDQAKFFATGNTYGSNASVAYLLTRKQTIGFAYGFQLLQASNIPGGSNTYFHQAYAFYSYQVTPNWKFAGSFGGILSLFPGGLPSTQTLGGSLTVIRTFTRGAFAATYSRGKDTENFISARFGDRGDATYVQHLGRLVWYNGVGYYREVGVPPQTYATYAASKMEFPLAKGFSLSSTYLFTRQQSDTPQLLSGIRRTTLLGVVWKPGAGVQH